VKAVIPGCVIAHLVPALLFLAVSQAMGDVADYVQAVQADNPLAYWRFEEASTSQAADNAEGTPDYDGTYTGGVSLVPGIAGRAASFNNSDAYVDLDYRIGPALHGYGAITMEAWINVNDGGIPAPQVEDNVVFSTFIDASKSGVILQMSGPNIVIGGRSQGVDEFQTGTAAFNSTGHWRHLVGVLEFGEQKIRIYLDGEQKNAGDESVSFGQSRYSYGKPSCGDSIGAAPGHPNAGDRYFNGLIDEVAVYGYALSAERIRAHFEAIPEPGTLMLLCGAAGLSILCGLKREHRRRVFR